MKEIQNIDDIQQMVNSFYSKVQKDELIGPIFNERIQDSWPEHLEKMYRFWETVLLDNHSYYGSGLRMSTSRVHGDRSPHAAGDVGPEGEEARAAAVRASGLRLTHGTTVAVDDATLELPTGALTAVVGPNGSGKSTLLRAMSGLHPVERGHLEVLGQRPGTTRRRLAHVLQSTTVNETVPITVAEVVGMGRFARLGLFGRGDRAHVEEAMERTDIAPLARRHLRELSGGQRQRVIVAQALAQRAEMLLLDEPMAGLDITSADRIDQIIREEVERGTTVVLTTHDLHVAMEADHVVLLATRVVASGLPEEVVTADHLSDAYGGHLHELPGGGFVLDDPAPH